jgi:adenosyl cobinamide kinase/adenosyl cobinamide phosphate guanylyltransferase
MILIIGGAHQGKREYAKKNYIENENFVVDFHLFVLDLIKKGVEPVEYIRDRLQEYKNSVIICDDIFCGIVPVDPTERKWRESLGRALAVIAEESDEVVRVFCGLGMKLK